MEKMEYRDKRSAITCCVLALMLAVAVSVGAASLVTAQSVYTMPQVVEEVISSNRRVLASNQMVNSSFESMGSVGRWPDPMLMLGIQNAPKDFNLSKDAMTMRMIGLSQDIPYSGYLGMQRKAARAAWEEASKDREATVSQLVYAARMAYLDVYYKNQLHSYLVRQQELMQQLTHSIETKFETSLATWEELQTAHSNLWRMESSLLSLQQELDAARYRLNALRGVDANSPLDSLAPPAFDSLPDTVSVWVDSASSQYPALAKLESSAKKYDFQASSARRMGWPMLNLSGSYNIRTGREMGEHGVLGEEREDMVSVQATISLPLFSSGGQKKMARSMQWMSESARLEAEQTRKDVESALFALYQRCKRLQQSIELYDKRIIPTSRDTYESSLAGYGVSRTSLAELLGYQVAMLQDYMTLTELQAELARANVEVLQYTESPGREYFEERAKAQR